MEAEEGRPRVRAAWRRPESSSAALSLKSLRFWVAFTALVAAGTLIPGRFSVTLTPSVDYRVFLLSHADPGEIRPGRYILFRLPESLAAGQKTNKAIKRVACAPGATLSARGREFFCDGEPIATAKALSLTGQPLQVFSFEGAVPKNKVFVLGDHKDSYDSRYWGFVDLWDVEKIAKPIF